MVTLLLSIFRLMTTGLIDFWRHRFHMKLLGRDVDRWDTNEATREHRITLSKLENLYFFLTLIGIVSGLTVLAEKYSSIYKNQTDDRKVDFKLINIDS